MRRRCAGQTSAGISLSLVLSLSLCRNTTPSCEPHNLTAIMQGPSRSNMWLRLQACSITSFSLPLSISLSLRGLMWVIMKSPTVRYRGKYCNVRLCCTGFVEVILPFAIVGQSRQVCGLFSTNFTVIQRVLGYIVLRP